MIGAKGKMREQVLRYLYVTARFYDEHYPDCPNDGGTYLNHDYFQPVEFERVRGYWATTAQLIREGRAPAQIGLYVHWPFCPGRCSYCFLNVKVPRAPAELTRYAHAVVREACAFRDLFGGIPFSTWHIGGGTPTFMPEPDLDELLTSLRACFEWAPGTGFSFEASPGTLTREKVDLLARHGVTHLLMGVQSLEPQVLGRARRRGQGAGSVERAYQWARAAGIQILPDLLYGMDGQTDESFLRDFAALAELGAPDIRVLFFEPRAYTPYVKAGRSVPSDHWRRGVAMWPRVDALAASLGYREAAPDPEAADFLRPVVPQVRDGIRLGASQLGLGAGAVSHAFGAAWYEHPCVLEPRSWETGIPPFRGLEVDLGMERRNYAIRLLYYLGRFSRSWFREIFGCDPLEDAGLAAALRDLVAWKKIEITPRQVAFLSKDKLNRLLYTKHLHLPGTLDAMIGAHRADFERFRMEMGRPGASWTRAIEHKVPGTVMKLYYGGKA